MTGDTEDGGEGAMRGLDCAELMRRWAGELELLGDLLKALAGQAFGVALAGGWRQDELQAKKLERKGCGGWELAAKPRTGGVHWCIGEAAEVENEQDLVAGKLGALPRRGS